PGIKEQANAIVKMNEDGTVTLLTGTTGLGTGAHTALAQIVAEELGMPFESVAVVHGDTDVVPWDIGAFASHTTFMAGKAAQMAATELKKQLLECAGDRLEAAAGDLEIVDGIISVKGVPNYRLSVREAIAPRRGVPAAHLVATATYAPTKAYSFAAHFVKVRV